VVPMSASRYYLVHIAMCVSVDEQMPISWECGILRIGRIYTIVWQSEGSEPVSVSSIVNQKVPLGDGIASIADMPKGRRMSIYCIGCKRRRFIL